MVCSSTETRSGVPGSLFVIFAATEAQCQDPVNRWGGGGGGVHSNSDSITPPKGLAECFHKETLLLSTSWIPSGPRYGRTLGNTRQRWTFLVCFRSGLDVSHYCLRNVVLESSVTDPRLPGVVGFLGAVMVSFCLLEFPGINGTL